MANRDIESEVISMTKLVKAIVIIGPNMEFNGKWKMSRNLCTSKSKSSCCYAAKWM